MNRVLRWVRNATVNFRDVVGLVVREIGSTPMRQCKICGAWNETDVCPSCVPAATPADLSTTQEPRPAGAPSPMLVTRTLEALDALEGLADEWRRAGFGYIAVLILALAHRIEDLVTHEEKRRAENATRKDDR